MAEGLRVQGFLGLGRRCYTAELLRSKASFLGFGALGLMLLS